MLGINRAIHTKASRFLLFSLLIASVPCLVRGDDLTGLPQNDPKDLLPALPAPARPTGEQSFVQMPVWARNIIMPPLPYQLKPMGKKPANAVATAPPPLAPPKDETSTSASVESTNPKPTPAPETPAMVAVSPFLQWIKSNPQAAAAQARQQANTYNASSTPQAVPPGAPGSGPTGPSGSGEDPYWLPPLIDSAGVGPIPVSGSAAIYSTPQR